MNRHLRLIFQMIVRLKTYGHQWRIFSHTKICYNFTSDKGIPLADLRAFPFRLNFNDFSIIKAHIFLHTH